MHKNINKYICIKYIFEILKPVRTVHFHALGRLLSSFGPSTFMLGTVHLHTLDRPLSVIRDRPLSILRTVHFLSFWNVNFNPRPSTFGHLDRPLSPSWTVHFPPGPSTFTSTVHFHIKPGARVKGRTTVQRTTREYLYLPPRQTSKGKYKKERVKWKVNTAKLNKS